MKKLIIILNVLMLSVCGFTNLQAENSCTLPQTTNTSDCAFDKWIDSGRVAILCTSTDIPSIQTIRINEHLSNTPIFKNHKLAKLQTAHLKQHNLIFLLNYIATTDAVAAHHYIYALRRIVR